MTTKDFFKSPTFKELQQIALSVHLILEQKKATLTVAESLTGGLVSHLLTLKPGASQCFLGSLICYSPSSKIKHLGISQSLLKKEGVVSESVSLLMAQSVKTQWGSDYALSLTGLAGPGKQVGDPPVGTVFIGFSGPQGDKAQRILLNPTGWQDEGLSAKSEACRWAIQQKSALLALNFLKTCI